MLPNSFKDKDSENLTKFLNFVAKKAKFELEVKEVIEFYGLLAWAQSELSQKIKSHVSEVVAVHEAEPEPKAQPKKKSK